MRLGDARFDEEDFVGMVAWHGVAHTEVPRDDSGGGRKGGLDQAAHFGSVRALHELFAGGGLVAYELLLGEQSSRVSNAARQVRVRVRVRVRIRPDDQN